MSAAAIAAALAIGAGFAPAQSTGGKGKGGGMESFLPKAQAPKTGDELVKVRLVHREQGGNVDPVGPRYLGVVFDIEPGWHIYWKNSGDSGAPPSITLDGVEDVEFGKVLWPVPKRHESSGGILDYIYEGQVTIVFQYYADRSIDPNRVTAEVDWLVCKDVCLPGSGKATFQPDLTMRDAYRLVGQTLRRVPRSDLESPEVMGMLDRGIDLRASFSNGRLNITVPGAKQLIFFPDPSDDMVAPTDAFNEGKAEGDKLSLAYSEEAQQARTITGVLEVTLADGTQKFVQVFVPGPAAMSAADGPAK